MEHFINRDVELQLIEEKFSVLLESSDFVRTPIIEFHGVGGIGKTTILRRIEQLCHDKRLPSVWADASQSIPNFSREVIRQIGQYNIQITSKEEDLPQQSVYAARELLARGPLIFLVDSLDAAGEEQLIWIEYMLRELVEDNRLFAILASKRVVAFNRTLSVARRLTTSKLKPFDQKNCTSFITGLDQGIVPEIRDMVFAWTHGYPLAVNAMVQAIRDNKLDPRKEQDRRPLLALMSEQVINRGVFSNAVLVKDDFIWCQTMLSLFSLPRSCNINIMQKMIEQFAPHYKRDSRLAYISLPKKINQTTDVLNWNPAKAGFSVEAPIRHMFLMKMKLEEPDLYVAIHYFLALANRRLADEVSGTDRIRYVQEYLYHSSNCEEDVRMQQIVEKTMQLIIAEPLEYFSQFYEDFVNDEELKIALGLHSTVVLSLIYKQFARINKQIAAESTGTERISYLRDFFYYSILDPAAVDLSLLLKHVIQQVLKEEATETCIRLYEELMRNASIKEKLGEDISVLSSLLASSEGG
jgi:hypothetical protein